MGPQTASTLFWLWGREHSLNMKFWSGKMTIPRLGDADSATTLLSLTDADTDRQLQEHLDQLTSRQPTQAKAHKVTAQVPTVVPSARPQRSKTKRANPDKPKQETIAPRPKPVRQPLKSTAQFTVGSKVVVVGGTKNGTRGTVAKCGALHNDPHIR